MATATVYFNVERDAAAIVWDRRPNDMPLDAVNRALYVLYQNSDLAPYLYATYDGKTEMGLLIAGNFRPGVEVSDADGNPVPQVGGSVDAEIRAVWDGIVQANQAAPLTGDLAPITVPA